MDLKEYVKSQNFLILDSIKKLELTKKFLGEKRADKPTRDLLDFLNKLKELSE